MNETEPSSPIVQRPELYFSLRHTLRAIRQFAEVLERDYDLAIIFLTVAEAGLQAVFQLAAVNAQEIDLDSAYSELNAHGLSILSIGVSTGIPKETVRRKLRYLVDKGYLEVSRKDRSLFVLAVTNMNPKILEIMNYHVADVGALVRTVNFYSADKTAAVSQPKAPAAFPGSAKLLTPT